MCGITGSGSGATAALGPAPAIATAIALALTATVIALDRADTSRASSLCYLCCPVFVLSIFIALCLAFREVAIEPYCLASVNALYPDLRCVVVLLFVEPYLHAVAPSPDSVPAQCTVLQYFSTVCALSGLAS